MHDGHDHGQPAGGEAKRQLYIIGDQESGFVIVCMKPMRVFTITREAIDKYKPGEGDLTYDRLRHAFLAMMINLQPRPEGEGIDVDRMRDAFAEIARFDINMNRTDFCIAGEIDLSKEGQQVSSGSRRRSYQVIHGLFEKLQPDTKDPCSNRVPEPLDLLDQHDHVHGLPQG